MILHLKTSPSNSLVSWLRLQLDHSEEELSNLLSLGAFYLDGQRLLQDQPIHSDQLLRLHLNPRRYSIAQIDWRKTILADEAEFLAVSKVSGIPTHPTLDNFTENQLFQLSTLYSQKLYPVQRLDLETSGVCIIGKVPQFQKLFHQQLKSPVTKKIYLSYNENPVKPGVYSHYFEKCEKPPHRIHQAQSNSNKPAQLEVLDCRQHESGYLIKVRLFTGRTHQIRAQLSFLKSPLIGDSLYGSSSNEKPLLHSSELRFHFKNNEFYFKAPCTWA